MYIEKPDIQALTEYVRAKYRPLTVVNTPDENAPAEAATHLIYEIGGNDTTRILTRVGDARPGKEGGDYILNIYPRYAVSGELVLLRKNKDLQK